MRTNRTPDEWTDWRTARNRIADELRDYYRACTTGELPPHLTTQKSSMKTSAKRKKISAVV
jgi:hypothetical protein